MHVVAYYVTVRSSVTVWTVGWRLR